MQIDILTLFPDMFRGPFDASIIKRAESKNLININIHDLRAWGDTERRNVDDRPYGGGVGMLLRVDVIDRALHDIKNSKKQKLQEAKKSANPKSKTILLDATGTRYTQKKAQEISKIDRLILIAGHYEGVDHRVHEHLVDEVISIGDFVLTGGELPAMMIVDSVIRLIPGVLGKDESSQIESHMKPGYREYPQYTRPEVYKKWKVPKVLLSGHHAEIEKWRNND